MVFTQLTNGLQYISVQEHGYLQMFVHIPTSIQIKDAHFHVEISTFYTLGYQ